MRLKLPRSSPQLHPSHHRAYPPPAAAAAAALQLHSCRVAAKGSCRSTCSTEFDGCSLIYQSHKLSVTFAAQQRDGRCFAKRTTPGQGFVRLQSQDAHQQHQHHNLSQCITSFNTASFPASPAAIMCCSAAVLLLLHDGHEAAATKLAPTNAGEWHAMFDLNRHCGHYQPPYMIIFTQQSTVRLDDTRLSTEEDVAQHSQKSISASTTSTLHTLALIYINIFIFGRTQRNNCLNAH